MIANIENIEPGSIASAQLSRKRREYLSPNGEWTLVLHSSFEWQMGGTGWKASLLRAGKNAASRRHKAVLRIAGLKGFQAPDNLQPWSFDSRVLTLVTWDEEDPVHLYALESQSHSRIQSGAAFPYCLQFSPDVDRLLISFSDSGRVYDQNGVRQFSIPWSMADAYPPFLSWVRGARFLWIGREVADPATTVRVYSGLDGTLLESERLDPEDLLPYDRHRYESISRTNFTLRRGRGTWSVGFLLDRWNEIWYDRSRNRLLLSVLRPVSPPYHDRQGLVCDVEERWITAILASA